MKPWVFASLLVVFGSIAVTSAAARATFIMTNGQRATGELVFHGGQGNNMIDDQLNLGSEGKEQSYPRDQVAVIDVVGGTPSQDELGKALASDQSVVLRDGSVKVGRFVNIQHGSTLVWRNAGGQEERYGLDQVARVYLNTQSARSLFNYNPPAASTPVPTTGGAAPRAVRRGNAIVVPGNQPWVDSGIRVRSSDQVSFHVTGQVSVAQGQAPTGPEGRTGEVSDKYPMPTMQAGALIGRVGNGPLFPIGTQTTPIQMPADGVLYLGVNDDFYGDNTGAFLVTVLVNGRSR